MNRSSPTEMFKQKANYVPSENKDTFYKMKFH